MRTIFHGRFAPTLPRFCFFLVSVVLGFPTASLRADFKDDIDFTKLKNEYGSSLPTGAGVRLVQVEYVSGTDWFPDNSGEMASKTITYRSSTTSFGVSAHANLVASYLCGPVTSITPGIAAFGAFEA